MRLALKISIFRQGASACALALAMSMSSGASAEIVLPTPVCGIEGNCLVFDEFTVYSLAVLNFQAGFGSLESGDPYQVDSSGTAIANALVIGSHPENAVRNQDLELTTTDSGYYLPDNISSGFANYLMTALGGSDGQQNDTGNPKQLDPDPIDGFVGDNVRKGDTDINNNDAPGVPDAVGHTPINDGSLPLWDITTSALMEFLGSSELVFYFNLNEENGGTLDSGQDMLGYVDVYLTGRGLDDVIGTDDDVVEKYTLSGNNCSYGPDFCPALSRSQTPVDDILPEAGDNWAYVHGEICVSDTGVLLNAGPCVGAGNTINQNLGANTAAFGLYSAALNEDLRTGGWDIMSVDLRMGHIGNGFEQLFILPTTIPEPGTLALFGSALLALFGFCQRRRQVLCLDSSRAGDEQRTPPISIR